MGVNTGTLPDINSLHKAKMKYKVFMAPLVLT